MSFIVSHDGQANRYEEFQPMLAFIADRLAYWNNFEVEEGRKQITLMIMKPPTENTLGIAVSDQAQSLERLS